MPRSSKPDSTFDRVLERGLQAGRARQAADCPAETDIAAYCDRSSNAAQRAALEAHFAGCARCQTTLAAIARARTERDGTAARRTAAHRWPLYTAIAAALAGICVAAGLIAVRGHPVMPQTNSALTSGRQPKPMARNQGASAQIALNGSRPAAESANAASAVPMADQAAAARSMAQAEPESAQSQRGELLPLPAAPASPSAKRALVPHSASKSGAFGFGAAAPIERNLAPPIIAISAPDGVVRWRVDADGSIERRQADGSWRRERSGVRAVLRAGAAPSSDTCWVVGNGGTILRTTGGARWRAINPPTADDLVAVAAADASSATVTAADGRRFHTDDGGRTWHPAD